MLFLKKNKFKIVLISVLLIIVSVIVALLYNYFTPDNVGILYGNRIIGIEEYDINNQRLKKVSSEFEQNEEVNKVDFSIQGRIINFVIEFDNDIDLDTAKDKTDQIIEEFEEEETRYFDLQVFIINSENEDFPKIGYKHVSTSRFIWSN